MKGCRLIGAIRSWRSTLCKGLRARYQGIRKPSNGPSPSPVRALPEQRRVRCAHRAAGPLTLAAVEFDQDENFGARLRKPRILIEKPRPSGGKGLPVKNQHPIRSDGGSVVPGPAEARPGGRVAGRVGRADPSRQDGSAPSEEASCGPRPTTTAVIARTVRRDVPSPMASPVRSLQSVGASQRCGWRNRCGLGLARHGLGVFRRRESDRDGLPSERRSDRFGRGGVFARRWNVSTASTARGQIARDGCPIPRRISCRPAGLGNRSVSLTRGRRSFVALTPGHILWPLRGLCRRRRIGPIFYKTFQGLRT